MSFNTAMDPPLIRFAELLVKEQAKKRPYHRFTEQEKQFISRSYAKVNTCCIANLLGLTTEQVKKFAERKRKHFNLKGAPGEQCCQIAALQKSV